MNARMKKRRRFIPVMELQKMPAEKIIKLWKKWQAGEIAFISMYPSSQAKIELKTRKLKRFLRRHLSFRISKVSRTMKKFSRSWYVEDNEKRVSSKTE